MTTKEFIAKLVPENQALIESLKICKEPKEAYKVAQDVGLTDSFEDFTTVMTEFHNSIKDLGEDDLQNVVGGVSDDVLYTVSASVSGLGTAFSAGLTVAMAAGAF